MPETYDQIIPDAVLEVYVVRYPHLRTLANNSRLPAVTARRAARSFAQAACNLAAPPGATVRQIYALAAVANGQPWNERG